MVLKLLSKNKTERTLCCSTLSPLGVTLASSADCDSPVRAASSRWELQVDARLNLCSFLVRGSPERSWTGVSDPGLSAFSRCPADGAAAAASEPPAGSAAASPAPLTGGNASPEVFPRMVKSLESERSRHDGLPMERG